MFRWAVSDRGIQPCIPGWKSRKQAIPYDRTVYHQQHRIENGFRRLEDWRRVTTRYDRCADLFPSACALAALVMVRLRDFYLTDWNCRL